MVVGEFTQETDVVVIGGGPAGYSCAFRAAELGVKVAIVDPRGELGGVCLHDGCVPSKTLLHIAEIIHQARQAQSFGVTFGKPKIDEHGVRDWVEKTVHRLAGGLEALAKKHGVERVQGTARFEDGRHLAVRNGSIARIRFRRAVIATGAIARAHPALPLDGESVLTPQQAVHIREVPKALLVLGSDYMAVELATAYAALGSKVTLVDETERVLPQADGDLTRPLMKGLVERLEAVAMQTTVAAVKEDRGGLHVSFEGASAPKPARFDRVIVAIGQEPNSAELSLSKTQVKCDEHGCVRVNEQMRTSDPRIFAVGDVTGAPMLADRALQQGRVCGEVLAGWNSVDDSRTVPFAVFSDPQIAWCGIMEEQARAQGLQHEVARIPWGASGRAVGMGRHEGVTKIIFDPDTKLVLGVGICGPNSCELISEGALAIEMGAVLTDLASTIHPHPTLSELIADAARQADAR